MKSKSDISYALLEDIQEDKSELQNLSISELACK